MQVIIILNGLLLSYKHIVTTLTNIGKEISMVSRRRKNEKKERGGLMVAQASNT